LGCRDNNLPELITELGREYLLRVWGFFFFFFISRA
jgi:hypothetical protein